MTTKHLPDVHLHEEAPNQKDINIFCRVSKPGKLALFDMQLLSKLTLQNFAGFSMLTSEIDTETFRTIFEDWLFWTPLHPKSFYLITTARLSLVRPLVRGPHLDISETIR